MLEGGAQLAGRPQRRMRRRRPDGDGSGRSSRGGRNEPFILGLFAPRYARAGEEDQRRCDGMIGRVRGNGRQQHARVKFEKLTVPQAKKEGCSASGMAAARPNAKSNDSATIRKLTGGTTLFKMKSSDDKTRPPTPTTPIISTIMATLGNRGNRTTSRSCHLRSRQFSSSLKCQKISLDEK